ncbi:glycine zipper domain-containing protein [Thalassoroseus pseudoceratinae]|uniref:glycine zipper domain-containing protein n=1 Tax=Thalassoroseus pseudoceratinae TaxID=2713176 RepID=UPI00141E5BD4|nr:glycine zipper domain-containing protein [Thalassoroseus pseudoceratinae]
MNSGKPNSKTRWSVLVLMTVAAGGQLTGCQTNTQTGALLGAGAGSIAGAVLGHQVGNPKTGAALGALAGAAGGGALGRVQDVEDERDAALRHASHVEASRAAAARALTNSDVITMAQNQMSDTIIINAIRTRGGRFRTNPEALIAMQHAGVSQAVIMEVQNYAVD